MVSAVGGIRERRDGWKDSMEISAPYIEGRIHR